MKVSVVNADISTIPQEEIEAYKEHVKNKYPGDIIDEIILKFDDEGYVDIEIHKHTIPFIRLRRITGYLVNSIERWNDGKKAEERDRVKHSISEV